MREPKFEVRDILVEEEDESFIIFFSVWVDRDVTGDWERLKATSLTFNSNRDYIYPQDVLGRVKSAAESIKANYILDVVGGFDL